MTVEATDVAENPETTIEQDVDYITGQLGDDGAAPEESEVAETEDAAPEDTQPSGDESETEPAAEDGQPPIEAPLSWSTEAKETFKALPREAQQVIADRERARDVEVRRSQNEAAEIRKAVETERQQYAAQLQNVMALTANFDPVIAQGLQTDWAKLAAEDPSGYIAQKAAFDDRVQKLQAGQAQLNALNQKQLTERLQAEDKALVEKIPEWADPEKGKAELSSITTKAKSLYGISPEEIGRLADHRVILVLRDAAKYHDLMAAQKAAKAKQVQTPPKRVQKPGGRNDGTEQGRALALKNRAAKTGSLEDRAAFVLAALDED